MRAWASYARALPDEDYRRLHAELRSGDPADRRLALHIAVVRRDIPAVVTALSDVDTRSRALAATIRLPVPDDAFVDFLTDAPRSDRRALYGALRKSRRTELADRLVPLVRQRYGSADVADLLPACTEPVVREWLPRVPVPRSLLVRLARIAPKAVVEHIAGEFGRLDRQAAWSWTRRNRDLLCLLAQREPDAIAVMLNGNTFGPCGHAVLQAQLSRPELLLRDNDPWHVAASDPVRLSSAAREALAALSLDRMARLMGKVQSEPVRVALISVVPQENRRALLEKMRPDRLSGAVLATLPGPERVEFAEHVIAVRRSTYGWWRLGVLAAMPYDHAAGRLRAATGSHRYQERTFAWKALFECVVREGNPALLAEVFSGARRAWHDQDAVRAAALGPVASARARLLREIPVDAFVDLVAAVTDARDTRDSTLTLVCTILDKALSASGTDTSRAMALLDLLARVQADAVASGDVIPSISLEPDVRDRLWRGIAERVRHDVDRGRYAGALRVAVLIGRGVPELDDLIGEIACTAKEEAAAAWWIGDRSTRDERVRRLVEHDPELGAAPAVWEVISALSTDLLDPVIASGAPLPGVSASRLGRWTTAQVEAYRARASVVAQDRHAGPRERAAAASMLADEDVILSLVDSAPPPVAAAALAAFGVTGDPQRVVPVALDKASVPGAVGRGAVRALRTVLDRLPDSAAADAVAPVLTAGSVGAAKEAARVLVLTRPTGAVDALVEAWAYPGLHHDVRAAVARALVAFLDDARTPPILVEAVRGEHAVRDAVCGLKPGDVPAVDRVPLAHVIAAGLAANAEILSAYEKWCQYAPEHLDRVCELIEPREHADVRQAAVRVLRTAELDARRLSTVVDRLVAGITDDSRAVVHDVLRQLCHTRIDADSGVLRVLVDACVAAGMHASAVRPLAQLAYRTPDLAIWDELIGLIDERPFRMLDRRELRFIHVEVNENTLMAVLDHLATLPGSMPGWFALDLLTRVGRETGWADPWPHRLARWREHPDPDVREAAWSIDPARPAGLRP
ncbi:hypothetical protein NLX83_39240 [Allokutzneria sp. A3M-2-11 16]|uniref:hypothetical protein n=1 Tax=Allokutzneria sp. A3M-2-11 16 TaxID=2962043 RepID=UPI0020B71A1E|nr:hypothetical protein [Allokutzneria sp. A3M-2-11 16]MCP3805318.1 hypothetical protein [Allokutzneria sp. A3M-2-11 16]